MYFEIVKKCDDMYFLKQFWSFLLFSFCIWFYIFAPGSHCFAIDRLNKSAICTVHFRFELLPNFKLQKLGSKVQQNWTPQDPWRKDVRIPPSQLDIQMFLHILPIFLNICFSHFFQVHFQNAFFFSHFFPSAFSKRIFSHFFQVHFQNAFFHIFSKCIFKTHFFTFFPSAFSKRIFSHFFQVHFQNAFFHIFSKCIFKTHFFTFFPSAFSKRISSHFFQVHFQNAFFHIFSKCIFKTHFFTFFSKCIFKTHFFTFFSKCIFKTRFFSTCFHQNVKHVESAKNVKQCVLKMHLGKMWKMQRFKTVKQMWKMCNIWKQRTKGSWKVPVSELHVSHFFSRYTRFFRLSLKFNLTVNYRILNLSIRFA